jgi:hypothetical protein
LGGEKLFWGFVAFSLTRFVKILEKWSTFILLVNGVWSITSLYLRMSQLNELFVTADYDKQTWKGSAWIPLEYFPPGVSKFNAYAIHGVGDDRRYEALFPVPGDFPDFHRLHHFQPIDFNRLRADNESAEFSDLWKTAMKGKD